MEQLKTELGKINKLFYEVYKSYDMADKPLDDNNIDALYVLYKNFNDLKYELEDYLTEWCLSTNTSASKEYNQKIQNRIEDFKKHKLLFNLMIPQYCALEHALDNKKNKS